MMERLTQDMADRAWTIIAEVEAMGGMTRAVESGWAKLRIEAAAAVKQANIDSGRDVIVGVNKFRLAQEAALETREIDNSAVRDAQLKRLATVKANRDAKAVAAALAALTESARTGKGNLLELAVRAPRARATVGEISDALEAAWGRFRALTQSVSGVYRAEFGEGEAWMTLKRDIEAFAAAEGFADGDAVWLGHGRVVHGRAGLQIRSGRQPGRVETAQEPPVGHQWQDERLRREVQGRPVQHWLQS
jgi:methylmalonyl-CoA mutase